MELGLTLLRKKHSQADSEFSERNVMRLILNSMEKLQTVINCYLWDQLSLPG